MMENKKKITEEKLSEAMKQGVLHTIAYIALDLLDFFMPAIFLALVGLVVQYTLLS